MTVKDFRKWFPWRGVGFVGRVDGAEDVGGNFTEGGDVVVGYLWWESGDDEGK